MSIIQDALKRKDTTPGSEKAATPAGPQERGESPNNPTRAPEPGSTDNGKLSIFFGVIIVIGILAAGVWGVMVLIEQYREENQGENFFSWLIEGTPSPPDADRTVATNQPQPDQQPPEPIPATNAPPPAAPQKPEPAAVVTTTTQPPPPKEEPASDSYQWPELKLTGILGGAGANPSAILNKKNYSRRSVSRWRQTAESYGIPAVRPRFL